MSQISEPLHADFLKILRQFVTRYGKKLGTDYFWGWVNKLGLNPDKPYGSREKFSWVQPFQLIKVDKGTKYFKVEACFPLSSMNRNVYTEDELLRAARTLVGKHVDLNHDRNKIFKGVTIEDAEFEGGAVEVLLKVLKQAGHKLGLNVQNMIDNEEIMQVSIEAYCKRGVEPTSDGSVCKGLNFTGLGLLTKDALPGIPLTRILPVEAIVEGFNVTEFMKMKEQEKVAESQEKPVKLKQQVVAKKTRNVTERIAKLKFEISDLKRKKRALEEDLASLRSVLEEKDKQFNSSEVQINALEREVDVLAGKLEQCRDLHAKNLKENSELIAKFTTLQGKHQQLTDEHKSMVTQLEGLQVELAEEQQAHFDGATENLRLTQELTERNNEILSLKAEKAKELTKLNTEILSLKAEKKDLEQRLKKAKRVGKIIVKV